MAPAASLTRLRSARRIHLVVLVHGYLGCPEDLDYLEKSITDRADRVNESSDGEFLLVHKAGANAGRTHDGIAAGGSRLASEINGLVRDLLHGEDREVAKEQRKCQIFLSLVGYSLGGMYARSALSEIDGLVAEEWNDEYDPSGDSDENSHAIDRAKVRARMFCTVATPNLGLRGQTYVRLPRSVECSLAAGMRGTGRDLFGLTDTVEHLATDPVFVEPLRCFRKRIAYANAFHTDLLVPARTAAFLSKRSDRISHKRLSEPGDHLDPLVYLSVETPQRGDPSQKDPVGAKVEAQGRARALSSTELAERLDALGWTKVFCDVRESCAVLGYPVSSSDPKSLQPTRRELLQQEEFSSSDLYAVLGAGSNIKTRWHAPEGHRIIVANSKLHPRSRKYATGQRIVDHLAAELVREIKAQRRKSC